jgi:adhesin transport system membrane fusion protein
MRLSGLSSLLRRLAGEPGRTAASSFERGAGQVRGASKVLLWAIFAVFAVLFVWAAFADVETVTRADGRVVPSARLQTIQNLEGGIVETIHIKQGAQVEAGQLLVTLSPVQSSSDLNSRRQQVYSMQARVARLQGQLQGSEPRFSAQLREQAQTYVEIEQMAWLAKRNEHRSQLATLDAQRAQKAKELEEAEVALRTQQQALLLAQEEQRIIERMVERGLEPRLELVRINRVISDARGRAEGAVLQIERSRSAMAEVESRKVALEGQFRTEALAELNRSTMELRAAEEALPALSDRLARTEIKAPMKGVVNRVFVSTVGGVVKPGEQIVEVVPADDELIMEALVRPQDIGFVGVGQKARVKVTAYDFALFGSMEGQVRSISPDAVTNEKGETFYNVRVETRTRAMEALDKQLPIIPGMQVQVDIITGSKTVLQFLSKPLVAMKENAFRER